MSKAGASPALAALRAGEATMPQRPRVGQGKRQHDHAASTQREPFGWGESADSSSNAGIHCRSPLT